MHEQIKPGDRKKGESLLDYIKRKQIESYKAYFQNPKYQEIIEGEAHFDWWIFPSSSINRPKLSVNSKAQGGRDVYANLAQDKEYCNRFIKCIEIYCSQLGMGGVTQYKVRLNKMIESLMGMTNGGKTVIAGQTKEAQDGIFNMVQLASLANPVTEEDFQQNYVQAAWNLQFRQELDSACQRINNPAPKVPKPQPPKTGKAPGLSPDPGLDPYHDMPGLDPIPGEFNFVPGLNPQPQPKKPIPAPTPHVKNPGPSLAPKFTPSPRKTVPTSPPITPSSNGVEPRFAPAPTPNPTPNPTPIPNTSSKNPSLTPPQPSLKEEAKRITAATQTLKKYTEGESLPPQNQIVQAFKASLKSQSKNPRPDKVYQGIGAKTKIVTSQVTGKKVIQIDKILSPEHARFANSQGPLGDQRQLEGKEISAVFSQGKWHEINDLELSQIVEIFHDEGPVNFVTSDNEQFFCQRNQQSVFVTSDCKEVDKKVTDTRYDPEIHGLKVLNDYEKIIAVAAQRKKGG